MATPSSRRDCHHPRARHQHGTYGAWRHDRCRCFACRYATSREGQNRRSDDVMTSGRPTALRLQALAWQGWGAYTLAARLGVTHTMVERWRAGRASVRRDTEQTIARLYDALWDQVPPSKSGARRAHAHAVRAGWCPPLALDDAPADVIEDLQFPDNPSGETPVFLDEVAVERAMHGDTGCATRAEVSQAVVMLTARGMSVTQIADRIGVTSRTIQRKRAAA